MEVGVGESWGCQLWGNLWIGVNSGGVGGTVERGLCTGFGGGVISRLLVPIGLIPFKQLKGHFRVALPKQSSESEKISKSGSVIC